jgi:hypothetical protein
MVGLGWLIYQSSRALLQTCSPKVVTIRMSSSDTRPLWETPFWETGPFFGPRIYHRAILSEIFA